MTEDAIVERLHRAQEETNAAIRDAMDAGLEVYVHSPQEIISLPNAPAKPPRIEISAIKKLL